MALEHFIQLVGEEKLDGVHEATVEVLEKVGVDLQFAPALELFKSRGAVLDGNRVKIPRRMLESAIETAPAAFTLWARDEEKSLTVGKGQLRTHVEPSNGSIYAQNREKGRWLASITDLINFFKLAHASEVCNINGGIPVQPGDIDAHGAYMRIFFETLKHTDKPIRSNVGTRDEIKNIFHMFEIAKGEKNYLKEHAAIYASVNPLSPLAYDTIPLETIMTYSQYGQPVAVLSCALAGVSAPMSLMGVCVMQNAEILAGLVLTQLVRRGSPFIYAPASAVPNMQTGEYVTGSPESNMINMVNMQLAREMYELPTRTMAGLTDAKTVDAQAGYETMQNLFQCMMGGASIINQCLGVLDSIMANSYEKFIIDEEMMSRILRFMEGINGPNLDLSVDVIKEICPGGTFLYHMSTMKNCRNPWRPRVSDWKNYDKWEQQGAQDVVETANRKYKDILAAAPESTLDVEAEKELAVFVKDKMPDLRMI